MVRISDYDLISGNHIRISDHCTVRQPTLRDIGAVGYDHYQNLLTILLVSKSELLKNLGLEDGEEFDPYSVYDMMAAIPELRSLLVEALSFFVEEPVSFSGGSYLIGGTPAGYADLENVKAAILKVAFIERDSASQHVFASEKARRIWEKCHKGKEALKKITKKDNDLDLPNLIGSVCAKSGSYTLLNIWDLTVYQLYDQFSRLNINVQMDIYASRWAAWGKDDFDVSMWFKNISKKEG